LKASNIGSELPGLAFSNSVTNWRIGTAARVSRKRATSKAHAPGVKRVDLRASSASFSREIFSCLASVGSSRFRTERFRASPLLDDAKISSPMTDQKMK
jgi:hypothetical protein